MPATPAPLRELLAGMAGRRTNLAILALLVLAAVTGAVAFAVGTSWVAWPAVLHGVAGLGLVLLVPWKWRIARRGYAARRGRGSWPGVLLAVLVAVTVVSGVLHATGVVLRYGPLDDMQLHVGAALAALPLAAHHVVARRTVPRTRDLDRRNLLRAAVLLGSAGTAYAALEAAVGAARLPGASRRASGSFERGSHDPAGMPATTWLFDTRPEVVRDRWTLEVDDGRRTRVLTHAELARHDHRVTAVLDCTSGWWARQEWVGVPLDVLLGEVPSDLRSVDVVSATGYRRRFPLADAPHLLLATRYEGQLLAARHGAPARLVAPGRRGFWWVKWVTHVVATDAAWWRQPPYPLR